MIGLEIKDLKYFRQLGKINWAREGVVVEIKDLKYFWQLGKINWAREGVEADTCY